MQSRTFIFVSLGVIAVVAAALIGASRLSAELVFLSGVVEETADKLTRVETRLDVLEAEGRALRDTLSAEQTAQLETLRVQQEAQAQLAEELGALAGNVSGQLSELEASDISAVVNRWQQYVYAIECTFELSGGEEESGGSATIEQANGVVRFVTNEHVLEEEGVRPESCVLFRPGAQGEIDVDESAITVETERDIGYGNITGAGIAGITREKQCTAEPAIGDRVVILGYPLIGGKESVTATEGIISGFDGDYYTTSAKIDQGNSGGAAIHIKNDCFLGLPTLVVTGRIESLARILPITSFE